MKGSCPAHVHVGLVKRLKHLDEVGAFPLREQRHKTVAVSDGEASGTEMFCIRTSLTASTRAFVIVLPKITRKKPVSSKEKKTCQFSIRGSNLTTG